ncbi:unnamed protein product, partial [Mesorhabditis belari]|uniref:UPAR/Ly6 domain-containing protein n=1 Tax=Mesorhabditis belari TaxID=2138241 RepID=A0AAF3FMD3_9BILA
MFQLIALLGLLTIVGALEKHVMSTNFLQCYKDSNANHLDNYYHYHDKAHTGYERVDDCPNCDFCQKVTTKLNDVWSTSWGCGCGSRNPLYNCRSEGRTHSHDNRYETDYSEDIWCCSGDLCNSSSTTALLLSSILTLVVAWQ